MFITTRSNPSALDPKHRSLTWPGPRILLANTDGQPQRDWIASTQAHYLVIDLATPPASSFDALRIAISRSARARVEMSGPLLFCDKGIPDNKVGGLTRAVRRNPWLVKSAADPVDGKLSMLVLGERIVDNPLFKDFFCNLHEGVTDLQTDDCIELIKKHLVWRKGERT